MLASLAYVLVGIGGAIFANATGAGGGVVFIPLFHHLGFDSAQAVATSFGIQCFGMTSGAIAWSRYYQRDHRRRGDWGAFLPVIALTLPASVAGLWLVYGLNLPPPAETVTTFASFSLLLGCAIILVSGKQDPRPHHDLRRGDAFALIPIALFGGIVTAWLSVGVGEFVAFYLILRRYDVTLSVAAAVVISALTVWSAAPQHFLLQPEIAWNVVIFAGPGAVLGAILARWLALRMGTLYLKRFFGVWLILIGVAELLATT